MFKNVWADEAAVSPVIATILMVAITVVLAGVLVVYMQQYTKTGFHVPTASSQATPFVNPVDGEKTNNGGGWMVKIVAVSDTSTQWGSVTVQEIQNGLPRIQMNGVKTYTSTFWNTNGTGAHWFAFGHGQMNYCPGGVTTCTVAPLTSTMSFTDMLTIENAFFLVIDTDGGNTLTAGDMVLVYSSDNKDITPEITSAGGFSLEFAVSGTVICSSTLD
jgi:flagellin-like protein